MKRITVALLFASGILSAKTAAQETKENAIRTAQGLTPIYRVSVTERTTKAIGGDKYNEQLSEERGAAVRDYLTQQGMLQGSVTAKGFGKTQPIPTNDTATGRQQNRRVELVILGEVIGVEIGVPLASK